MITWLLAIVGVFACYFVSQNKKNPRKFFLISAGIVIVLILGSRYFINGFTDEVTYNYLYQGYSKLSFKELTNLMWGERDFGFYLFYWTMSHIIPWSQFPIYFITAAFISVTFRFIYKNTNGTIIPVLVMLAFGIFSFHMAAYRQCFAMCLCILAYEFAKKRGVRGIIPYAILMFIATQMHISAIIFIPVYFLIRIKRGSGGGVVWVISLIATALAATGIMTFASEILESEGMLDTLEFSTTGLLLQVFIMAVPLIFAFLRLYSMGRLDGVQWVLLILTSLGILFLLFKYVYFTYERISYYYSFFVIGAFSNAIDNLNHKKGDKDFVLPAKVVVTLLLVLLAIWRMPSNLDFFFLR